MEHLEQRLVRVLIVDDEPHIRTVLGEILDDEGYAAESVSDGAAALSYLRQAPVLPEVILLDLNMPIMSGWQFRVEQLNDDRLAAIPVVVISAGATVQQQARNIRAEGYLAKPIGYDELVAMVARFCRN